MASNGPVVSVVVARPLFRQFDYQVPKGLSVNLGQRIRVPFGNRDLTAIVVKLNATAQADIKLKNIKAVLDTWPVVPEEILQLMRWAAQYYHHPLGECLFASLPPPLRTLNGADDLRPQYWQRREQAPPEPRARKQFALYEWLSGKSATTADILAAGFSRSVIRALEEKGLIVQATKTEPAPAPPTNLAALLQLRGDQSGVLEQLQEQPGYGCHLIYGVTGSGKTEVYLHFLASHLKPEDQALVMVPEINLTPQMLDRFRRIFGDRVAAWHSGLNNSERTRTWLRLRDGEPLILVGTRSAVLLPLVKLAAVIVDEEHDSSYKQNDGFRYSGRDLAVYRAHQVGCPVILGSATPSLESLYNVQRGRYRLLRLTSRAGAKPPALQLLDIRSRPLQAGLSQPLLERLELHLAQGNQVLVFINRRGFAPVMMCGDCGHIMDCPRCDSRLAFHSSDQSLRCHHCDFRMPLRARCPKCQTGQLCPIGQGTEQAEDYLKKRFAPYPVVRVDRDSTRRKGSMDRIQHQVREGLPCILVGTQMLAKGHDFPGITLAAVVNADASLFSVDFRAPEQLMQTLIQVAGRAGRGEKAGEVIIQTCHAEHPLLQQLAQSDYLPIARELLEERQQASLPPATAMAVIRAEAATMAQASQWLDELKSGLAPGAPAGVQVQGPLPALMARRADRYRALLVLQAPTRSLIHQYLALTTHYLDQPGRGKTPRWAIDVDPLEVG